MLYDNSGAQARRVGRKRDGIVALDPSAPSVLIDAIRSYDGIDN